MRTANLVVAVLDWWLVGDVWMGSEVQSECGNARRDRIFFFFLFFFILFFLNPSTYRLAPVLAG